LLLLERLVVLPAWLLVVVVARERHVVSSNCRTGQQCTQLGLRGQIPP
jgi:hypothetical protein